MGVVDIVSAEHGPVDMDRMSIAELYVRYHTITRRRKLASIYRVRSMKTDHILVDEKTPTGVSGSLAKRGLTDVSAFKQFFADCGVPVLDMS